MTDETHSVPVASQVKKWFELVVEGEELEDQASTQKTEKFNVCTLYKEKSKILVRSSPGYVRVDRLQLLIYFCD